MVCIVKYTKCQCCGAFEYLSKTAKFMVGVMGVCPTCNKVYKDRAKKTKAELLQAEITLRKEQGYYTAKYKGEIIWRKRRVKK